MPLIIIQLYYSVLTVALIIKSNWTKLKPDFSVWRQHFASATDNLAQNLAKVPRKYVLIPLILVAILTTLAAISLPDQYLHVSFLDVGEGDATLIQSSGQNILVDGGPTPQAISLGLSQKLPFWEHTIDLVILTHPHLDHLSGLIEVLNRYNVKAILAPEMSVNSAAYDEWMNLIKTKNIPLNIAEKGQQIKLNNGVSIEILNPPPGATANTETDMENLGIVLKLSYGRQSFLLTADIFSEAETRLIKERGDLSCTVLKVAHHGSNTSTSADFLNVAHPQAAVISCGAGNLFGHPQSAVLERLTKQTIYRTDLSGSIEFTTDGSKIWVKTNR